MKERVLNLISLIRDSFIGSQEVYSRGSCFHLYLILKEVFPSANAYYSNGHVVTEIEGLFYDITGEVIPDGKIEPQEEIATVSLKYPFNIYSDTRRK